MKKILMFVVLSVVISVLGVYFYEINNELGLLALKYLWTGIILTPILSGISISIYREVIKNDTSL
jgi:hypothetical protein